MGFGNDMGMGWMWLFWLLLIVGAVLLIVVVVRAVGGGMTRTGDTGAVSPTRSRARQVLDERYARGELTTEEYRERLQTLGDDA